MSAAHRHLLSASALSSGTLYDVRNDATDLSVQLRAAIAENATNFAGLKATLEGKIVAEITKFDATLKDVAATAATNKEAHAKAVADLAASNSRLLDMEQKLAGMKPANDNPSFMSPGRKFIEDSKVKSFLSGGQRGRIRVVTNVITSVSTGDGGAGDLIVPTRVPGLIDQRFRRLRVRDLLTVGKTTSNSIEFVQETGFTNAAAPVAEGELKPTSSINFDLQTAPVRTIAHILKASVQILQDVPMLESFIDTRLRIGLALEEEDQLLTGNGIGQNILGLIPQATAFDTARQKVGDTRIDIVRRAMTQLRIAEYQATAIVLHPTDWEIIELTKESGTGAYVWANPRGLVAPTLWGLPVLDSTALQEGEFLIGAFDVAAQIWDRQDATVELATENEDDFVHNLVTFRAEERLALTVYRPESFIYGDFDSIVSS